MSCDVGKMTEKLENELCYDYNNELCSFFILSVTSPTSQFILQPFRRFTSHSSFSNPSVASPTSQFIHQPFFRFSYVTNSSLNSSGEPPMCRSMSKFDHSSIYRVCYCPEFEARCRQGDHLWWAMSGFFFSEFSRFLILIPPTFFSSCSCSSFSSSSLTSCDFIVSVIHFISTFTFHV